MTDKHKKTDCLLCNDAFHCKVTNPLCEEPEEKDYAFRFKCQRCGKVLKDGKELVILCGAFMSGNTPVITKYKYYHPNCFEDEMCE